MTTKIIGINEYRTKLTKLWKEAREKNVRYIVVVHNKPVLEVRPILWDTIDFEPQIIEAKQSEYSSSLSADIDEAMQIPKSDLHNI